MRQLVVSKRHWVCLRNDIYAISAVDCNLMNKLTILLLALTLKIFAQDVKIGGTISREEWLKMANKGIANMIPDSSLKTISKKQSLYGQILSICEGVESHWGTQSVGVIEFKSFKDNLTYSILTNNNKKYTYKAGETVKIKVYPLTKTDKYFVPRQLTCMNLNGNIICVVK